MLKRRKHCYVKSFWEKQIVAKKWFRQRYWWWVDVTIRQPIVNTTITVELLWKRAVWQKPPVRSYFDFSRGYQVHSAVLPFFSVWPNSSYCFSKCCWGTLLSLKPYNAVEKPKAQNLWNWLTQMKLNAISSSIKYLEWACKFSFSASMLLFRISSSLAMCQPTAGSKCRLPVRWPSPTCVRWMKGLTSAQPWIRQEALWAKPYWSSQPKVRCL